MLSMILMVFLKARGKTKTKRAWSKPERHEYQSNHLVSEVPVKPPGFRWMYTVMDWVSKKDMVTLAGLDNIDVTGKQAFEGLGALIKTLMERQDIQIPHHLQASLPKLEQDLQDYKKCFRRHIVDSLKISKVTSSHCMTHALNPDEECAHNMAPVSFALNHFMP